MVIDLEKRPPRGEIGDGPAVLVSHLPKRFGDRMAFEDVSFEVGQGSLEPILTTPIRREVLLVADAIGWPIVAPMFDRERLITGRR